MRLRATGKERQIDKKGRNLTLAITSYANERTNGEQEKEKEKRRERGKKRVREVE